MGLFNRDEDEEGTVLHLLAGFYRRTNALVQGKHGPTAARISRVLLVVFVLGCAGPILWQAFLHMPVVLWVFILAAVALRVGRWAWRKGYFRR
jgi:hypothetical protein